MSLLGGLKGQDEAGIETEKDQLGGGGPLDSALYAGTITMAYLQKSSGGALGLITWFETADKKTVRETFYVTSGDAKGNLKYYEKEGQRHYLPGYNMASSLCLLAAKMPLEDMPTEMKTVGIYDFKERKDVPTEVEVLTTLIGKPIITGLIKQEVNKRALNKENGKYENVWENGKPVTRFENEHDKFFRADTKLTTAEIRMQVKEPVFYTQWEAERTGTVRNKVDDKPPAGGGAVTSGGGASAPAAGSLFAE